MTSVDFEKHSMIACFHMAKPQERIEMLKKAPNPEYRDILCRGAAFYPDLAALVVQMQTSSNQNIDS